MGEVNAFTGKIYHIADEQSEIFIHYRSNGRYDLNGGEEMLWISERDGWRHIYLICGKTGQVKRQLTKGEWVVCTIDYVDRTNKIIYFTALGFNEDKDPYNFHQCRINKDGRKFMDMTPENANHIINFSKNRQYFVDVYSHPDLPPVSQVKRTSDVTIIAEIQHCIISDLVVEGWQMPEMFHAKGRDGKTDIWGNIIRPSNFNATKTYSVIEMIYTEAYDLHVNKNFRPAYHLISRLADLGFIVVSIDGMGTFKHSKAFHDVCWKNLKDVGFPDKKLWIKSAAEKYSYMDISKVGIYGWSTGGQNAMGALLFHNDFYKVVVAFCGCHDNWMDKIWRNEQWMGYPIDESYSACSNVNNAHLSSG
ncbi:MAG: S9 family peptidase [Prevotellaceae bacterium]|nr:S9 family peptidase [Prevotellaceae bacterium]